MCVALPFGALVLPSQSAKLHRGAYAIQVHGKVPDDILQELNKGSSKRKPKSQT